MATNDVPKADPSLAGRPNIEPHLQTRTDDGGSAGARRQPIVGEATQNLVSASVETYLNGWSKRSIREAIREAFEMLESDSKVSKETRTDNARKLALHLHEIATQIDRVSKGVSDRAAQSTATLQAHPPR